jgi:hypothetical protein
MTSVRSKTPVLTTGGSEVTQQPRRRLSRSYFKVLAAQG